MSDESGDLAQAVLDLERAYWRLPDVVGSLAARSAQLEQSLWASWSTAGFGSPPPETNPNPCGDSPVTDFPNICPCFPGTITLHDSYWGDCDIVFDPDTNSWTGCKIVAYPGGGGCFAHPSCPIHYTLFGNNASGLWSLKFDWLGASGCMGGGTCTDATNVSHTVALPLTDCNGPNTLSFGGTTIGGMYPFGAGTITITINLPDGS